VKKVKIVGIWETVLGAGILETVQVAGILETVQDVGIWETASLWGSGKLFRVQGSELIQM
jgi:hypothetical protein